MAEGEGFEPPMPCGTPVFKTGAINHSAIPPVLNARIIPYYPRCSLKAAATMSTKPSIDQTSGTCPKSMNPSAAVKMMFE